MDKIIIHDLEVFYRVGVPDEEQATRLCRPATRRTEWEQRFEPIGTGFSQGCSPQFRSAGRPPERARRPRYLFLKRALRLRRNTPAGQGLILDLRGALRGVRQRA